MLNSQAVKPYRTKEEYVYAALRGAIMRGELKPGDKLVIDSLCIELGVSTIPVRTALQRLEVEGLVDIRPHTGAIVSTITLEDVEEVFALLENLESFAFCVASERATNAEIDRVAAIVQAMDDAVIADDPDRWAALNTDFHLAVATVTGMSMLEEFTGRVLDRWDRLRSLYLRSYILTRMAVAQQDHHQMLTLLRARDSGGLGMLAGQHNRKAGEAFKEYYSNSMLEL